MHAFDSRLEPNHAGRGMARASLSVTYGKARKSPESWWIEAPTGLAGELCGTGEPWLALLLPLAFTLGEPIELELPAPAAFVEGLHQVMRIWSGWYPQFSPVELRAPALDDPGPNPGGGVAAMFSGGVDSVFSVVDFKQHAAAPIDELIFLRGFDIRLRNTKALSGAEQRVGRTASRLGRPLIVAATNARDTRLREANWERLAHASVLCAVGLLLQPRYRQILIGSAFPADMSRPLGSHPSVFPLFSRGATEFVLHAPDTTRAAKIAVLAQRPELLADLRVCWESEGAGNCGRCAKCLYTMAALDVFGVLGATSAFPTSELDHKALQASYLGRKGYYFKDVRDRALVEGRTDIAASLDRAIRRSAQINRLLLMDRLMPIFHRLRFHPGVRRATARLRPFVWWGLRRLSRLLGTRA
jgi:hypothetical protein